jgi:hypothetical protein
MVQFHPGVLHNQTDGGAMALSHPDGTRVVITNGDYRNKVGTVRIKGKITVIVLDNNGGELMGADDRFVRKL